MNKSAGDVECFERPAFSEYHGKELSLTERACPKRLETLPRPVILMNPVLTLKHTATSSARP